LDLQLPVKSVHITTKVEFTSRSWQGVLDATLCDRDCQWFSPGIPSSPTNTTDRHDITEILLKAALNTITLNQNIPNAIIN
jgi:hypothetical protein